MSDDCDCPKADEISDKEKFARLICGTTAAFLANKGVVKIFDLIKANRTLKELTANT